MGRAHGAGRGFVLAAGIVGLATFATACTDVSDPQTSALPTTARTGPSTTTAPAPTKITLPPAPPGAKWSLAFADDFKGSKLDGAHWSTCYSFAATTCTNSTSKELELYTPRNVSVASGELLLGAAREVANASGRRFDYTSGMISSAGLDRTMFSFRYGFIEARARVPVGRGLWSAFWLLPRGGAVLPEIDIFEIVGHQVGIVREYTHWQDAGGEQQFANATHLDDTSGGWHVYGLDWEPSALTWYVDGRKVWSMDYAPAVPKVDMTIIANLAVGGGYATAPIAQTRFPAFLRFDYIKVWRHS